ncbi:unnamed protein product [Linum tenue]|uniref:Fe2OG dioxygenase domain-containing protein n=1 Tax=Linum tenue TaxID=586396 RepID=A0AAV0HVI7_9ROSI|nr:unnamed protein product [Linum tenue]
MPYTSGFVIHPFAPLPEFQLPLAVHIVHLSFPNTSSAIAKTMDSVHEIAITGQNLPAKYIYTDSINPSQDPSIPLPLLEIPVIDFNRLATPSIGTGEELERLRSALSSYGCVMVTNHRVASSLMDRVRLVFKQFLALPMEERLKWQKEVDGFDGYGSDMIVTKDVAVVHDFTARLRLITWPEDRRQMKYWPEKPHDFREVLDEYSSKLRVLHDATLKAMARSLNLEDDSTFLKVIREGGTISSRFNFYPPCPTPDRVLGLKPHSDGTVITFVLQDREVEGLQVLKDEQWFRVPIVADGLVLNVGDQLEIMSNGEFKSPIHRVVLNPKKERISMATLSFPQEGKQIEPFEGLVSRERPRLYRQVKYNGVAQLGYYQSGKRVTDEVRI